MSHYLVGVIVDKIDEDTEDRVSELLAPYDENMRVEPYIYKTKAEIIQRAKERKERYSKDGFCEDYMKPYKKAKTDEELYQLELEDLDEEDIDEDGNELSTYNPNSKWDWWTIGGRFMGNDYTPIREFKCYEDVDVKTRNLYERAWANFNGEPLTDEEDYQITEENFNGFRFWKNEYYLERYKTCENWIKESFSNMPYALLDENGWHEKGQMGWFGCDNATTESIDDYTQYAENYFTNESNKDKYIVWVDCHI